MSQKLKYLNFKCEQSEGYFFILFYSFHHFAHVWGEKFRWQQAKSVSGNQIPILCISLVAYEKIFRHRSLPLLSTNNWSVWLNYHQIRQFHRSGAEIGGYNCFSNFPDENFAGDKQNARVEIRLKVSMKQEHTITELHFEIEALWWELPTERNFGKHPRNHFHSIFYKPRIVQWRNNNKALTLQKTLHPLKVVDIATGSGWKTTLRPFWLHLQMYFTTFRPSDSN